MTLPKIFGLDNCLIVLESINFSIFFSILSESFNPSGPNSFNPLSKYGLCDAVIIIPIFALIVFVSIARPFVGSGPNVVVCIPAEVSPETNAGSRVYPDNLVSFAIIAVCFVFFKFLKYVPAARPNLKNFSPFIFP